MVQTCLSSALLDARPLRRSDVFAQVRAYFTLRSSKLAYRSSLHVVWRDDHWLVFHAPHFWRVPQAEETDPGTFTTKSVTLGPCLG